MSKKNKILIFGADSFTAKYFIDILNTAEFEIFGTTFLDINKPNYFKIDITVISQCSQIIKLIKPDYVINFAAISFVPTADLNSIYQINLIGAMNILESIRKAEAKPKKIILISTAKVYDEFERQPYTEKSKIKPSTHYGESKYLMEKLADYYSELNILITRPFNYTGVGQNLNFLVPKIVSHYSKKEKTIELGNLDIKKDFLDVRDVAEAYKILMLNEIKYKIINISSFKTISINEIIKLLDGLSKHKIEIVQNPRFMRANEIKEIICDNTSLINCGWEQKYSMFETLQWMFAYYKKVLNK